MNKSLEKTLIFTILLKQIIIFLNIHNKYNLSMPIFDKSILTSVA